LAKRAGSKHGGTQYPREPKVHACQTPNFE
jgi:hypothetical protein